DPLSYGRDSLGSTSIDNYAIFAGGFNYMCLETSSVDVYDDNLIRTSSVDLELSEARFSIAATSVGNYALFAGGYGSQTETGYKKDVVDVYQIL
ncbi:MAG TPA: hypothetical protein P5513_08795, partial [Candidatus Diapherotrites archaeon]|nr:hypothetical protein [Candidatus Diapherotrites archaeon]